MSHHRPPTASLPSILPFSMQSPALVQMKRIGNQTNLGHARLHAHDGGTRRVRCRVRSAQPIEVRGHGREQKMKSEQRIRESFVPSKGGGSRTTSGFANHFGGVAPITFASSSRYGMKSTCAASRRDYCMPADHDCVAGTGYKSICYRRTPCIDVHLTLRLQ